MTTSRGGENIYLSSVKRLPLTQGKYAIVDAADFEYLNKWKWSYNNPGYAVRRKNGKLLGMHRDLLNTPEGMHTDHINGNKLDNRRSNLRICTLQQNAFNKNRQVNNSSGYTGVARFREKWQAYINKGGKRYHLGHFVSKDLAAQAYNDAAKELFGEFARLNNV